MKCSIPPGTILYRKLSLRSKLGFGKYAFGIRKEDEPTVKNILNDEGGREYLLWLYYNRSNIDFLPEVMELLDAPQIINKPGVAPEIFGIIKERQREAERKRKESLSPKERKQEEETEKKQESRRIRAQRFYEIEPSGKYFQSINQGHRPMPNPKSIYSK